MTEPPNNGSNIVTVADDGRKTDETDTITSK